jgi:hypothetical protein
VGQERQDQQDSAGRSAAAEQTAREHQANANQVRDEPVPAGPQDDRGQDAVRRNEELAASSARQGRQPGTADDAGSRGGDGQRDGDDNDDESGGKARG